MEVGASKSLAMFSIKLRLVDWLGLTVLAFSHLCSVALVFCCFVTHSCQKPVEVV